MANIVAKLSVKAVGAKPEIAKINDKETDLCLFMGIARGLVVKTGKNDDPVLALVGDFEGTNLTTGEVLQSGVLYLPSGIAEMYTSKLEGDSPAPIKFAVKISSFPAANPIGYSYKATPVVQAADSDPLAELRAQMQQAMLPPPETPKDEEKPTDTPKGGKK